MAVDVRARVSEEPSDNAAISRNISQVDERAIALIAPNLAFERERIILDLHCVAHPHARLPTFKSFHLFKIGMEGKDRRGRM